MNNFVLFARPWWVNLLFFVPIAAYIIFKGGLAIAKSRLFIVAVFGAAFGFVEAAVVVYLRAATGMYASVYQSNIMLNGVAKTLFTIEFFREFATVVMLACVALLAARNLKERAAIFLWAFAFWDIFYYIWLWVAIRWPNSLTSPDVLFLIPVPWIAQVWFPLLISLASLVAVAVNCRSKTKI
jgi:hypothetical protein